VSHYGIAVVRMKARGRGREAVTAKEGVAGGAVQMDVDSGMGGRGMMVRVKLNENGQCKMMLKSLRVVLSLRYSVMPLLHERDRYRRI
jgi:hypothetical protein